MAEGGILVTVPIIMHFASGHEKRAQRPPVSRAPAKSAQTKTSNSCGTVVLNENLWSVPSVVRILDDRDALRGSRNIVISSRDTVHDIRSRFRRDAARVLQSRCTSAARRPTAAFPAPKCHVTEAELVRKVNRSETERFLLLIKTSM